MSYTNSFFKNFLIFLFAISLLPSLVFANTIPANHPNLAYSGRWLFKDSSAITDWPGTYIKLQFTGSEIHLTASGKQVIEAFIDGQSVGIWTLSEQKQEITLAKDLSAESHNLTLIKRSEGQQNPLTIHGFRLANNGILANAPTKPQRRIEFIGDSYTVGYGMESLEREPSGVNEDSLRLQTTNAGQNFGALIAKSLGAEYQINAISGRGLVKNINGVLPLQTLPVVYNRTLISTESSPLWDFNQWHPQVIVIGLGINDFQGHTPPPDSATFTNAYRSFLSFLRQKHPNVQFILCATKVWPRDELKNLVKSVVEQESALGNTDVTFFEYGSENTGLHWHPSSPDHQNIARSLRNVVAKVGRWMSR